MKSLMAPRFGIHATSDLAMRFPRCFLALIPIFAWRLLPRDCYRVLPRVLPCLLITANRRRYARSGRDAQPLIEEHFFKCGEEQQHIGILAGLTLNADGLNFLVN